MSKLASYKHTHIHIQKILATVRPMEKYGLYGLRLFVKKWQPKVCLAGCDILFAYFVVEAKGKKYQRGMQLFLRVITRSLEFILQNFR